MAHLSLTIDADPARRQQFLHAARTRLATLPGLQVAHAELGDLAAVWAHGATTPHSQQLNPATFGLLLGTAIDDGGQWLDAAGVATQWTTPATHGAVFDGFFIAAAYAPAQGLVVGVDPLGLFPLYYAECGGALIAGTSPELLRAHPQFVATLDLRGLTGILLIGGLLGNQALLHGVKRLAVGHQLRWTTAAGTHEVETYRLRPHDRYRGQSLAEVRELVDDELRRAIQRHRPPGTATTLLLSGGLDSRLMAGYLREAGATDSAVCLGQPTDMEVQAATRVTAALEMCLHREPCEPTPAQFLEWAYRVARWEHLSGGFAGLELAAASAVTGPVAPLCWSGFVVDNVLGGTWSCAAHDPVTGAHSGVRLFALSNRWGVPVATLQELVRAPDCARLVQEQIAEFHRGCARDGESPAQQVFRTTLATRVRNHHAAALFRLSFGSWPLLPILDRRLLDVLFNVPPALLLDRALEKDLLVHRFPRLAAIPRDQNSFLWEPVRPTALSRVRSLRRLRQSVQKQVGNWYWNRWRGVEPRRYYRYYDLDGPLWGAVRRAAESSRGRLDDWLDRTTADRLLPGPDAIFRMRNPFEEGGARRMLLGLLLWSAER